MRRIDLTGKRVGRLTVLSYVGQKKWLTVCDCGTRKLIQGMSLRVTSRNQKTTKSCGCLIAEVLRARKGEARPGERGPRADLSGMRFGTLVALSYVSTSRWICQCDCGKKVTIGITNLRIAKSCGCKRRKFTDEEKVLRERERMRRRWREDPGHRARVREYERGSRYKGLEREWRISLAGRASVATRYENRKARLRGAEATLTTLQWALLVEAYGEKCAYCGNARPLCRDHFVPIDPGGTSLDNTVPACRSCNSSKGRREIVGVFQKLGVDMEEFGMRRAAVLRWVRRQEQMKEVA